jgi:hypothetical protein
MNMWERRLSPLEEQKPIEGQLTIDDLVEEMKQERIGQENGNSPVSQTAGTIAVAEAQKESEIPLSS